MDYMLGDLESLLFQLTFDSHCYMISARPGPGSVSGFPGFFNLRIVAATSALYNREPQKIPGQRLMTGLSTLHVDFLRHLSVNLDQKYIDCGPSQDHASTIMPNAADSPCCDKPYSNLMPSIHAKTDPIMSYMDLGPRQLILHTHV